MGTRKPQQQQLSGQNAQLRAALQRIKDGAVREGVREIAEAHMIEYGLPVGNTTIHSFNAPLNIKRMP